MKVGNKNGRGGILGGADRVDPLGWGHGVKFI
jgi:hypothetical protein